MKFIYLIFISFLISFKGISQEIIWQKSIGSFNSEISQKIINTSDGGFVIAAYMWNSDSSATTNLMYDYYIIKTDDEGNVIWEKTFGGSNNDFAKSIIQTSDGGYLVIGYSYSKDGDISNPVSTDTNCDIWVIKLSSSGIKQWEKSYGTSGDDFANDVIPTNDNGYLICGNSYKAFLLKINQSGTEQWTKYYNTEISGNDAFNTIINTKDGNYIAAGYFSSDIGDYGGKNPWIIKFDTNGDTIWSNVYLGHYNYDVINAVIELEDESIVFTGGTESPDGGYPIFDLIDVLVGKVSKTGDNIWLEAIGGYEDDEAYSICKSNTTNNVIISGHSKSNSGLVNANFGLSDYWIVELNSTGDTVWTRNFGGSDNDIAYGIIKSSDNKYIVCGTTYSNDNQVENNNGIADIWLLKLSDFVDIPNINNNISITCYPNPTNGKLFIYYDFAKSTKAKIKIYNLVGELIKTDNIENSKGIYQTDFNNFAHGIYYINISNDEFTKTVRVVYE